MIKIGLLATHATAFATLQDLLAKKVTIAILPRDHKLIDDANDGKFNVQGIFPEAGLSCANYAVAWIHREYSNYKF
jgi:hypothetical protein